MIVNVCMASVPTLQMIANLIEGVESLVKEALYGQGPNEREAADALAELPAAMMEGVIEILVRVLKDSKHYFHQADESANIDAAASLLMKLPIDTTATIKTFIVNDDNDNVTAAALRALMYLEENQMEAVGLDLLQDQDKKVKLTAIRAVEAMMEWEYPWPNAVYNAMMVETTELLLDPHTEKSAKLTAIAALWVVPEDMRNSEVATNLANVLRDQQDDDLKATATDVLVDLGL